ncbi:uroporphyrinogen-III synthase [Methanocalculus chunghsingensis]|uniref:Uroporphyrinogen-III synthase n=1 Tax=Methanocalculus chunghsingensis TaxID=156457 RepID=A0A8J8B747_9EURY|nr:uroporphyrinogen-III synthase [Methanocalculus chunghsingensis]MBR1369282.1 uroporphyrinogen-III synthase [Methanocalculus chunghsingensis]
MIIAVTRLPEKAGRDEATCEQYGHSCRIVSPLRSDVYDTQVQAFVLEANRGAFDCIFFTSALPAELIAPLLRTEARVVAIGPQTARVLEDGGISAETLPTFYSRDFVPYLGDWIDGKAIGIPRADVPNPGLIRAIEDAGGIAYEYRCYGLIQTNNPLDLEGADAILFTSANSFTMANWDRKEGILPIAIGDITADAMRKGGVEPAVIGDGSMTGTLEALNTYLRERRS